ncbi:MAG TPA: MATE family efflux transporter [candidate division Zixibacteria bacterium]|jgi:putative MATE family efflux protein
MPADDLTTGSSVLPGASLEDKSITDSSPRSTRDIYRSIWRMGYPSMIGFAATNLYTLADMFWVARLGPEQVAALTFFAAFYWAVSSFNMIAGTGSVAVIARRFGEGDMRRTEIAIGEAFILKFILAAMVCGFGYWLTPRIMMVLGAEGVVLRDAVTYGRILFFGMIFNFPAWTVYTALRGIGQPRAAMILMIGSTVFNAILDPFLIFGLWGLPRLEVAGAAWASVIGFGLTVTIGLILFFAGAFKARLSLSVLRQAHISTMWQMMKIGIPSGIGAMSFSLARMAVLPLIARFGPAVVAVYGAGNRVIEFGEITVVGLELGMSPLIGHALGAKDKALAWLTARRAIEMGLAIMGVFALGTFFFAEPITMLFFRESPYVELGVTFFRVAAVAFPMLAVFILIEGAFVGAGDTVPPMVIGIIHAWVLQIPLVWLLAHGLEFGPTGAWWGFVVAAALGALMYVSWFARKRWLEQVV